MADTKVFDVLIVGGGFAGLSAAGTLARQLHTAVVFDSGSYRNARSKHLHMMPTWDHQDPESFRAAARADLKRYDTVELREAEIQTIAKLERETDAPFEATDSGGRRWRGRKVILASGVEELFPALPGYDECWARGIYHCLFCHGYEQRGAESAGVLAIDWIASARMAMHMAHMASSLVRKVTIYTNGDEALTGELVQALGGATEYHVDARAIAKISYHEGSKEQVQIQFEDGSDPKGEAFLAHSPRTRVKGPFAAQLGLELTATGDYVVQPPFNETSVKGVFAAGDCTSMFKVGTKAVADGSMAGAGVSARLQEERLAMKPVF